MTLYLSDSEAIKGTSPTCPQDIENLQLIYKIIPVNDDVIRLDEDRMRIEKAERKQQRREQFRKWRNKW